MELEPSLLFYLEHKTQIDEWHALGKQLPPIAHEFFWALGEPLANCATSLPDAPTLNRAIDSGYPRLMLVRPGWLDGKGRVKVGIGFEWHQPGADFGSSFRNVWVNKGRSGGDKLYRQLKTVLKDYASSQGYKQSTWSPLWAYNKPPADHWKNLGPFGKSIVEDVCSLWRDVHQRVGEVVAG